MKNLFILAFLCLISNHLASAKQNQNQVSTSLSFSNEDSTWMQKMKYRMDHRRSQFILEGGFTFGPSFSQGLYMGFEYTQKTDRAFQPGLFINYSSFTLQNELNYYHERSSTEDRSDLDNTVRNSTERNYFKIRRTDFLEVGASVKYDITKSFRIKTAITFNSLEFLSGAIKETSFDSVFMVLGGEQQLVSAIEPGGGGTYFDNNPSQLGFKDFFALHLGLEQRLSRRLRLTARASIPLREVFPKTINYPDYIYTSDEQMTLEMENPVLQPIFLKFGFSYTI